MSVIKDDEIPTCSLEVKAWLNQVANVCFSASRYANSEKDFYKVLQILAKPKKEEDYTDIHYSVWIDSNWNDEWGEIPELEEFIKNIKEA